MIIYPCKMKSQAVFCRIDLFFSENLNKYTAGFSAAGIAGIERALGDQDVTFMVSASW